MKNVYPGINPHLNSRLQSPGGGWESFHTVFINKLTDHLEMKLAHNYCPYIEIALQSNEFEIDEDQIMGIVIYRFELGDLPGEPITRIELLSPGNTPGGAHHPQYMHSRRVTLQAGLRLVEIDFLHETRPVIPTIPIYGADENAYLYHLIVSDPRPSLAHGQAQVYGFRVCETVPVINLPLHGQDQVTVDFGAVYDQSFENRRAFQLMTDYTTQPIRIDTYDAVDQNCIQQVMADIQDKAD